MNSVNGESLTSPSELKSKLMTNGGATLHDDDDDVNDVIIKVSAEVASMTLGFALDAAHEISCPRQRGIMAIKRLIHEADDVNTMLMFVGGSVTKLIYRSNKDYKNNKRLQPTPAGEGVLRLHKQSHDLGGDKVLRFLQSHCDLGRGSGGREGGDCFHTGVQVQHYINKLDTTINLRTKLMSETNAMLIALMNFYPTEGLVTPPVLSYPPPLSLLPVSPRALDAALVLVRALISMMNKAKDIEEVFSESAQLSEGIDVGLWAQKLLTHNGSQLQQEVSLSTIRFPCILVSISSAMPSILIDEKGSQSYIDFNPVAGKSVLGIGMLLTGAKSFSELVALAKQGDHTKVDTMTEELKNRERVGEDDFYSVMPEGFSVFLLGKLCDEKYQGTYSKSDLAAGLVRSYCKILAKLCICQARLHKGRDVIMAGSFLGDSYVRDCFEEGFYYESLTLPFFGGELMRMAVLEHSGFICALGAWSKNLQHEKELRAAV